MPPLHPCPATHRSAMGTLDGFGELRQPLRRVSSLSCFDRDLSARRGVLLQTEIRRGNLLSGFGGLDPSRNRSRSSGAFIDESRITLDKATLELPRSGSVHPFDELLESEHVTEFLDLPTNRAAHPALRAREVKSSAALRRRDAHIEGNAVCALQLVDVVSARVHVRFLPSPYSTEKAIFMVATICRSWVTIGTSIATVTCPSSRSSVTSRFCLKNLIAASPSCTRTKSAPARSR